MRFIDISRWFVIPDTCNMQIIIPLLDVLRNIYSGVFWLNFILHARFFCSPFSPQNYHSHSLTLYSL